MSDLRGLGFRALAKNVIKTFGRQVWGGGLQLLLVMLIARAYGPAGNGTFTVALLLPSMLATLLGLGLVPANVYYISSKRYGVKAVVKTTAVAWLVLSSLGLIIGGLLVEFRSEQYFPGIEASVLWVFLASFPALLLVQYMGGIFQGQQNFTAYNLSLSVQPTATLVAAGLCVVNFPGEPVYLGWAVLIGNLAAVAAMVKPLLSIMRRIEPDSSERSSYPIAVALAYGYKSHLANIVAFLNYRIDIFLVNFLINPIAAGIYGIAVQLCEKLWLLSSAINTVLLPRLAEISGNREHSYALTTLVSRLVGLVTLGAAIATASFGFYLIHVLFGVEYEDAYFPLLILLPGIVAASIARVLSSEIAARGRPELNMYMALAVVVVNVVGNVVLIPYMGINGAALATTIAYVSNLAIRIYIYRYYTGVRVSHLLVVKSEDVLAARKLLQRQKRP